MKNPQEQLEELYQASLIVYKNTGSPVNKGLCDMVRDIIDAGDQEEMKRVVGSVLAVYRRYSDEAN